MAIIPPEILYLQVILDKPNSMNTDNGSIPAHVAIIMDGNGRWAKEQGKDRSFGHVQGVESVRTVLKAARVHGIKYLTLYVFSTENWGRPKEEVDMLMELFCSSVVNELPELKAEGVRVKMIGDRDNVPAEVLNKIELLERETDGGEVINLIFAMNYSSRAEITEACRRLANEVMEGKTEISAITPEMFSGALYTVPYPDPDLIIRTGGERRLSNFLLWQGAYSELYFTPVYWPDFGEKELDAALAEYASRERRFGVLK